MNDFLLFIGCVFAAFCLIGFFAFVGSRVAPNQQPLENGAGAGAGAASTKAPKVSPVVQPKADIQQIAQFSPMAQPPMHPSPYSIAATAIEPVKPATPVVNRKLQDIPPWERKHTGLAGATNSGKTATLNTLLANDIRRGAHCIVCSTHYTAYHPEDQQIDLRGITHLFEVAYTPETIRLAILAAARRIDERLALYRAGKDVGQDTVLYLGEWGSISRNLGKEADSLIQKILDEGRKTKVWLVIELHSAIVGRFGGDSGLREAFRTRLAHTVDKTTWAAFVGKEIEHQPVALGYWMTSEGLIAFDRPTPELLNAMAETMLPNIHEYLLPISNDSVDASSAGVAKPADHAAEKTGLADPSEWLSQAILSADEPVQLVSENGGLAAPTEEKPRYKPLDLEQFKSELDKAIAALLYCGIKKNAIVRQMQWPDGLKSKPYQLKRIDSVIEKMVA